MDSIKVGLLLKKVLSEDDFRPPDPQIDQILMFSEGQSVLQSDIQIDVFCQNIDKLIKI